MIHQFFYSDSDPDLFFSDSLPLLWPPLPASLSSSDSTILAFFFLCPVSESESYKNKQSRKT
jgi:hypothetical protein